MSNMRTLAADRRNKLFKAEEDLLAGKIDFNKFQAVAKTGDSFLKEMSEKLKNVKEDRKGAVTQELAEFAGLPDRLSRPKK